MYLRFFGLREYPFSLTPDTSYFFDYDSHRQALNVLLVALQAGEGFIKVSGEVGLGKTLVCRTLLNCLGEQFVTAYIPDPQLSSVSMRLALAEELGIDVGESGTQEQILRRITHRLIELAREGKQVVVCLDEAQQLPEATLEAVRLLTNLETEKRKLLQVVLFGQPELDRRLLQPSLRQLRQRISFSHKLRPLTRQAVAGYVEHRLRVAGYRGGPLFTPNALKLVFAYSRGIPRLINILCHKAILAAFGPGSRQVTRDHVLRAVYDTEGVQKPRWRLGRRLLYGLFTGLAGAAVGLLLFGHELGSLLGHLMGLPT